ncbi:hypothetical protein DN826_00325 [Stutzerimonas nosocomialis]|uniref:glycosyltransferase n=1 Tax=Stutzerimonas nosocomialis TaxID=1056496 RepID=UPI001107DFA1|nr:glycosyltransferase [Stutzerimonas nosocomialis]TLX59277.1 hypothetical protein DN826_00325 [Stutzerimonas nosocomialis]
MKILIDMQSCQSGSRHGGIGRYSLNLAEAMVRNRNEHDIHFLLNGSIVDGFDSLYAHLCSLVSSSNVHTFSVPVPVREVEPKNSFRARSAEILRENFVFSLSPDVVHVTSLVEGFGDDVSLSVGRSRPGQTTAVTLYDLIPLIDKENYLSNELVRTHYLRKIEDLKNAGLLLSISEFSRDEALQQLALDTEKIVNISSAIDAKFMKREFSVEVVSSVKGRYGVRRDFLMYTGSFDQRKNHAALIKSFAAVPKELRHNLQLLIIGNGWEGVYSQLRSVAARAGLSDGDVIFAGKVSDEDLLVLYNNCLSFVFPSLREGFGLPVLEAMACGAPVIGSNTTSIPEVLGLDDALFDPSDIASITSKICKVLVDSEFRSRLSSHGLERAKEFSWDISAKKAILALEELHARNQAAKVAVRPLALDDILRSLTEAPFAETASSSDLESIALALEAIEIAQADTFSQQNQRSDSIGFVTTWNERCGISLYSQHLVSGLETAVSILAPYARHINGEDGWNVCRCWEKNGADLSLLTSVVRGCDFGVLVVQFNYGFFEFNSFAAFLTDQVRSRRRVIVTLHSTTDPAGDDSKRLSALAESLSECYIVLVHSKRDMIRLASLGVTNVNVFPHGVIDYLPPDRSYYSGGKALIASYGFFLPHKGLIELIEAVAKMRSEGFDVHLKMVNAQYPAEESARLILAAQDKIRVLNLENVVELICDFLPDEESLGHLAGADLVVFPYQETGESSSAAVRAGLAARRPVAVTPLSIFDDVSEAVFVLPGTDSEALAVGISQLLQDIESRTPQFRNKTNASEKWLASHSYGAVAKRLERLIAGK